MYVYVSKWIEAIDYRGGWWREGWVGGIWAGNLRIRCSLITIQQFVFRMMQKVSEIWKTWETLAETLLGIWNNYINFKAFFCWRSLWTHSFEGRCFHQLRESIVESDQHVRWTNLHPKSDVQVQEGWHDCFNKGGLHKGWKLSTKNANFVKVKYWWNICHFKHWWTSQRINNFWRLVKFAAASVGKKTDGVFCLHIWVCKFALIFNSCFWEGGRFRTRGKCRFKTRAKGRSETRSQYLTK